MAGNQKGSVSDAGWIGKSIQKTPEEAAAWRAKNREDGKKMAANGPAVVDLAGLTDFIKNPIVVPVSYKKKDILIYAVAVGCDEERWVYELNKDFEMFPMMPASLFRKGDSDDVHFQKNQPVVRASGFPYRTFGFPPMRMVFDAERYIEMVKPMPVEGGTFNMRFENTSVQWKKEGRSVINEYRTTIEDQKTGEVYYRCWSSGYAIMTAKIAKFDQIGPSGSVPVTAPLERAPDATKTFILHRNQPLLYRHTGDFGPAEASLGDPPGFNGLGSLAIAVRMVLNTFGQNEAKAFHAVRVRFTVPVAGKDILETQMWLPQNEKEVRESGGAPPPGIKRVIFRTVCKADPSRKDRQKDAVVMASAFCDLHEKYFKMPDQNAKL